MQQLGGIDTLFVRQESARTPMHIGLLFACDPSTAPGRQVGFDRVRAALAQRSERIPLFRRRLAEPSRGYDYPYWVEDRRFDVDAHLSRRALARPGDWQQLCDLTGRLQARGLDLSRPPWEAHLIEGVDRVAGLRPGCFAVLLKVHHAAIDGMLGARIFRQILDPEPGAAAPADIGAADADAGGVLERFARIWNDPWQQPARYWRSSRRLVPAIARVRAGLREQRFRPLRRDCAQTRFNRPIGTERSVDGAFFDLHALKAVRRAVPGASLNDVVLAIVAGALRAYLLARGDPVPAQGLLAGCPISVRGRDASTGNQLGMMRVDLYGGVADPLERLARIRDDTAESKQYMAALGDTALGDLCELLPPRLSAFGVRVASDLLLRGRIAAPVTTIVSNVPGPRSPLYFCGAEVVRAGGLGPIVHRMGMFHAVFSYRDTLSIMVNACPAMLPDADFYAQCLQDAFDALSEAAGLAVHSGAAAPGLRHGTA